MHKINKSHKLDNVFYDLRGPVLEEAKRLEEEGHRILKLNIGNPAPFGLDAPDEIIQDVIYNLPEAQGYTDSKGLFSARKAVMQYYQKKGLFVDIDDIILGNGVSELIVFSLQALLNQGDEVLIPAPDYPLWTGSTSLAGGKPIHYYCDEASDWAPDIDDIRSKITDKTKAIVVINPNNPTGAVYSKDTLQQIADLAAEHKLVLFADEIYEKIIFDEIEHTSLATLNEDVFCITFNGLSKAYRLAGFRSGWMVMSGNKRMAQNYIEGLNMLSSMRLCSNAPAQLAIQTALGGYQSIEDLVRPGGRIYEQRNKTWEMINAIPGISCTKPMGALYAFPKIDPAFLEVKNDEHLILDLLKEQKILLVHGSAFNCFDKQHFRIVFLPRKEDLEAAMTKVGKFFEKYSQ